MSKTGIKSTMGFSVIELSIVLLMAASMAAMAIPMLSDSMRNMQLLSDARSIATTMTYAKVNATSHMTRCQLTFNMESKQWQMQKFNRTTNQYELQQAVNGLSNGIADSGIHFKQTSASAPTGFPSSSSTTITFNSRGIPDSVGIVYLSGRDTDYAISVSLAGKIQVWRLQSGQWSPV